MQSSAGSSSADILDGAYWTLEVQADTEHMENLTNRLGRHAAGKVILRLVFWLRILSSTFACSSAQEVQAAGAA